MSHAVREAFVQLHDEGLVYRGHYIINWCPRCLTALSNEEAEKEEVDGQIWHLRYPLARRGPRHRRHHPAGNDAGDTAVAVHPEDERYRHLIGQQLRLPVVDRVIPSWRTMRSIRVGRRGQGDSRPRPRGFEIGRRQASRPSTS